MNRIQSTAWSFVVAGSLFLGGLSSFAGAQTPPPNPPAAKPAEAKAPEPPKKDPKIEEYEKAIKDLKKSEGALNLYTRKKDILMELPMDRLGQIMMIQATFNTGVTGDGTQAGFPVNDVDAFRIERREDQLWFIRPNFRYRWTPANDWAVASDRSFPEAILLSGRIEAENPEKKLLLVNVSNLFAGEVFRLSELINQTVGGNYMLDREKSGVEQIKNFPKNTIVRMFLHYATNRPAPAAMSELAALFGMGAINQLEDARSCPIKITYNAWWREASNYQPRIADPRIGYFTTDFFDVAKFFQEDRIQRLINRYHLEKKDPKAAVSEPITPIVWYVDNSIPKKWRKAVADGILFWNKAFDALGYKNAVVVKDAPDNDPNWDHADCRYNVVRAAMSPDASYAIALFRTDPFTGEILNSGVNLDANMFSFPATEEYDKLLVPTAKAYELAKQAILGDPESTPLIVRELLGETSRARESFKSTATRLGWSTEHCDYGALKVNELKAGYYAALASGARIEKDEYIRAFLRDLVSHEVGHCMGLRHNFIGSTIHSCDELTNDAKINQEGITASVMDYLGVNLPVVLRGGSNYWTPCIGAYDIHAIRYGYVDSDAKTPDGELSLLAAIASQSGVRGNAFMTDEDADSFNPYVVRFDNSSDPLEYIGLELQAARRVRNYAVKSLPRPGESYARRNQLILASYNRLVGQGNRAARFVGGVIANRQFRGDVGEKPNLAPVAPETQRAAMVLVTKECLSTLSVEVPESVIMSMGQDFNTGSAEGWTAPLRSIINRIQVSIFGTLMSADRVARISENEFKWRGNPKAYTLAEHFRMITDAVFSDARSGKPIAATRRDLQAFAVDSMIALAGRPAGLSNDARILANRTLRGLSTDFDNAAKSKALDEISRVHLSEMQAKIERFFDRETVGQ